MAIVTFWSDGKEQSGKTMSAVAIATYAAVERNMKVLLVSTSDKDETLQNCFIAKRKIKTNSLFSMFAAKPGNDVMQSDMTGLVRMARSSKVTPDMIRNYTRVVFNEVLEILYTGRDTHGEDMSEYYPTIIKNANQCFDLVIVDLDTNIRSDIQSEILQISNLIVANLSQRLSSIDRFMEERKKYELLASKKTMVLVGRYDRYSKYTSKNITRYMGDKTQVLTVPYNTLLYDVSEEAGVPNYFLNYIKNPNLDIQDRNYLFFKEVGRAVDEIHNRLRELQVSI